MAHILSRYVHLLHLIEWTATVLMLIIFDNWQLAFGQEPLEWVDIDMWPTPQNTRVSLTFGRSAEASQEMRLIIAALNVASGKQSHTAPLIPTLPDFAGYTASLTGWFVAKDPKGAFLWVGVQLPKGETKSTVTVIVSELIRILPTVQDREYELDLTQLDVLPKDLAREGKHVRFAAVRRVRAFIGAWGTVETKRTVGWRQGGRQNDEEVYEYYTALNADEARKLIMVENPNWLAEWLNSAMPKTVGTCFVTLLVLVILGNVVESGSLGARSRLRILFSVAAVLSLILLFVISGWPPTRLADFFFRSPILLGFTCALLVASIIPNSWYPMVTQFFKAIHDTK